MPKPKSTFTPVPPKSCIEVQVTDSGRIAAITALAESNRLLAQALCVGPVVKITDCHITTGKDGTGISIRNID